MKVNLGCGGFPTAGWVNVDAYPPADIVADMRNINLEDVERVEMSHSLEHVPHADTGPLLARIRSWMIDGGKIRVEVPDMAEIMRRGATDPWWQVYIYGAQAPHAGETHRSGFTAATLTALLERAGWKVAGSREFLSDNPVRPGMPCLEAWAEA